MTGKIKTLRDKGFGFIAVDGEAKDLFFHSNDLEGVTFAELKEGDMLNFDIATEGDRKSAKKVTRA